MDRPPAEGFGSVAKSSANASAWRAATVSGTSCATPFASAIPAAASMAIVGAAARVRGTDHLPLGDRDLSEPT